MTSTFLKLQNFNLRLGSRGACQKTNSEHSNSEFYLSPYPGLYTDMHPVRRRYRKQEVFVHPHVHRDPHRRHPNWGHPDHDACGTGFVARLAGPPGHDIIEYALTALERLTHRGGVDADGASGDGAGLLISLPHSFFRARALEQGIALPEMFGLGFAFLPKAVAAEARAAIEAAANVERLRILGWRCVPTNPNSLGRRALEILPEIWQFYVAPFHAAREVARFEWRLALLRKRAESQLPERCYLCSLSPRTVVYTALLTPSLA